MQVRAICGALLLLAACSFELTGAGSAPIDAASDSPPGAIDAPVVIDGPPGAIDAPAISDAPVVVIDGPPAPACATAAGYVAANTGIRYRAVATARSWAAAQADCASVGAHLVVINSATENAHVDGLLATEIWIGYSDQAVEGTFVWVTGTSSYTNWRPDGNPNDGSGTEPQDCAEIDEDGSGLWNDDNCPELDPYVCECPP